MSSPVRPITELAIGGAAYRVQSSADEAELIRLAALIDARLGQLPEARRHDSRSLVLVALGLAHDLEAERAAHAKLRHQVAERLTALLGRVDEALDHHDENGDPLPPVPVVLQAPEVPVVPAEQRAQGPDAASRRTDDPTAPTEQRGAVPARKASPPSSSSGHRRK